MSPVHSLIVPDSVQTRMSSTDA